MCCYIWNVGSVLCDLEVVLACVRFSGAKGSIVVSTKYFKGCYWDHGQSSHTNAEMLMLNLIA